MKPKLPPITIGIPFYNAENTLLDAVRSVFAQTHEEWELILLDDGSTDRSLELAMSIKDPRVKVFSDGENKRLAARLNQVPGLAKYDYLARMDADDLMSPKRIEIQLDFLVSHPELDLVSTGICSLTNANYPVGTRCPSPDYVVSAKSLLTGNSAIVHASLVGNRSWFLRNKYRENLRASEDANLWIRAFSRGDLKIGFVGEPYYYYREDGNVKISKLITAYREGIRTIVCDSGSRYSVIERARAASLTMAKMAVARALSISGFLDLLRRKRSGYALSEIERENILLEIERIKSTVIPL